MADLAFTVDYKQLKAANAELERTGKVSKNSAQAFEAAFSQVVKWQQKFATEQGKVSAKLEETHRKQNLANKSARESASVFQALDAQVAKVSSSYSQLKASIDPVYAAQLRMRKAHETVRAALKAETITRSEAAQSLIDYRKQTKALLASQSAATKGSNRFGVVTQQAGYQIGDFLVQVQSGTNPMVAFGQQATQLVGILPLMTGAFGLSTTKLIGLSAGLGIAIPLLTAVGAWFLRSKEAADKSAKSIDKFDQAVQSLDESLANWVRTKKAAELGMTVDELLGGDSLSRAKDDLKSAREELSRLTKEVTTGSDRFKKTGFELIANYIKRLGLSEEEIAAIKKVEAATIRLADIQRRLSEERVLKIREEKSNLEQSLQLEKTRLKYGEDSQELKALVAQQELEAYGRQVAAMDLSEKQKADLIEAFKNNQAELAKLRSEAEEAEKTIDRIFRNRTVMYSIRFSGDEDVMSQSLTPSTKGMKPTQSYQDLIKMGWTKEDLERIGVKPPRKSGGGGGKSKETNEKYLNNLLRETKLKAQLVGVSEQEAAKLKLLNTLEAKGIDLNDDRVKTLIEEQKNLAELEKAYEAQQEMAGMFKDTLTDALMSVIDGSRSVADAFKNMIRQMLTSLAQKSIIQPLVSGLTGGIAGGAAGGLMGGLAAGTGIAATMGAIGTGLSTGFMTSVYGGLAGTAGAVSGGLSVAAGGGAAALGGAATAIGAIAAPLLAVAAVFSFFKKKVKELDSGISATVTNMDSYVESFSTIQTKRFWGLSKKVSTNTTAMDADNPISLAIASVQQSIFSTAQYLGIATDSLSAFSYEFKLSLKGLSEEAKMQKIAEEVNKLGDAFANLLPNVLNMEHLTAIMDERYSLETRLLEAQGNTEALRERELANTNEYNRAILEQIFAAEDAKAALDNLNNSLKETDFATLLDFNRAKAYARLGMNVANSPEVPSMSNTAASGVQAITSPMNTASGEIVQLRSEMKEMHKEAMFAYSKLIKNGKDSRDTLRSWDVVGLPAERTA